MNLKKRKPARRTPDLTVEVEIPLQVFSDKPRSGVKRRSAGVVTSYDPAVNELAETPHRRQAGHTANGHAKFEAATDRQRIKDLGICLGDCLRLAQAVESKRAAKIIQLLRDAHIQLQRLGG